MRRSPCILRYSPIDKSSLREENIHFQTPRNLVRSWILLENVVPSLHPSSSHLILSLIISSPRISSHLIPSLHPIFSLLILSNLILSYLSHLILSFSHLFSSYPDLYLSSTYCISYNLILSHLILFYLI